MILLKILLRMVSYLVLNEGNIVEPTFDMKMLKKIVELVTQRTEMLLHIESLESLKSNRLLCQNKVLGCRPQ